MVQLGLKTLRWLMKIQTSKAGSFEPIGSNGFYPRGKTRALFDQQPIEAQVTVSACIEAFHATNDPFWVAEARRAFEWFLGRNDLGLPLYDSSTGRLQGWVAHGPGEPKPGRGIDAGIPDCPRRNADAPKHDRQLQGTGCRIDEKETQSALAFLY